MDLLLSVTLFVGVGAAFVFVNLLAGAVARPSVPNPEKAAVYECGEPSIGTSWIQFDLRFYIVALVYLILVAQFESFLDPFIILFAIPPGLMGVLLILLLSGTTLNIMSLMGLVMMVGIVVSNSILIVDFSRSLWREGKPLKDAVAMASRIRLRPVLMTSLATLLGLIPMALKLGTGAEAYAPLARAIIGGLLVSVVVTVYLVPAAYLWFHGKDDKAAARQEQPA